MVQWAGKELIRGVGECECVGAGCWRACVFNGFSDQSGQGRNDSCRLGTQGKQVGGVSITVGPFALRLGVRSAKARAKRRYVI